MPPTTDRDPLRDHIAKVVRGLRRERGWTQAELAKKLGISQGRLSQIESGSGSFSAEQMLTILKLFNVTTARFVDDSQDRGSETQNSALQNALARLGARHLYESDQVLPLDSVDDVGKVVGDTLSVGNPRLTAALAPVLVSNIDRVSLSRLQFGIAHAGFERRLPWLCENIVLAIHSELKTNPPRTWSNQARRAEWVLDQFCQERTSLSEQRKGEWDALDTGIRTVKTAVMVKEAASQVSRKWRIITSLVPEDFAHALRESRASHQ